MYGDVTLLADQLRQAMTKGKPGPAMFLGAGASLASGSVAAREVLSGILRDAGIDSPDTLSDKERISAFFHLLEGVGHKERYQIAANYLKLASPSPGYMHLSRLVAAGYFSTLMTTSFDTFLESSLYDADLRSSDLLVLDAGAERIKPRTRAPRVTLIKLRGDPYSPDFFTRSGEVNLVPEMADLLRKSLSGEALVVGYSSPDKAFAHFFEDGKSELWYVNPEELGSDDPLARVLSKRRAKVVTGELGYFDRFFGELAGPLLYTDVNIDVRQSIGTADGGGSAGSAVGVRIGELGNVVGPPRSVGADKPWTESGVVRGAPEPTLNKEQDPTLSRIRILGRQLEALQRNAVDLEKKIAQYGVSAPLSMRNERESLQREITRLQAQIDSMRPREK